MVAVCLIQCMCNSQRIVEYKIQQFAGDNDRPRRFSTGAAFNQSLNKKLVSDICDWVVVQTTCALDQPAVKDVVKMAFHTGATTLLRYLHNEQCATGTVVEQRALPKLGPVMEGVLIVLRGLQIQPHRKSRSDCCPTTIMRRAWMAPASFLADMPC